MRSETYRDKAVDSGEEPRDKEKNELKQKLNESEGMTEIKSGLTGRDQRQWWERKDIGWGKRKDEGGREDERKKNEKGRVGKGRKEQRDGGFGSLCHVGSRV